MAQFQIEFEEGVYVDLEINPNNEDLGTGLGGRDGYRMIPQKAFEESIDGMTSFLKATAARVRANLENEGVESITVSMGVTMGAGGHLIVASSTTETSFSIDVTLNK